MAVDRKAVVGSPLVVPKVVAGNLVVPLVVVGNPLVAVGNLVGCSLVVALLVVKL